MSKFIETNDGEKFAVIDTNKIEILLCNAEKCILVLSPDKIRECNKKQDPDCYRLMTVLAFMDNFKKYEPNNTS